MKQKKHNRWMRNYLRRRRTSELFLFLESVKQKNRRPLSSQELFEENMFRGHIPDVSVECVDADFPIEVGDLHRALQRCSAREAKVINLRYGLGGGDDFTYDAIAKVVKVSRERVRQIERQALAKMRAWGIAEAANRVINRAM